MFRKLAIAVITAVVALLETVADAITATLPPPAADSPRLRVVAPGRLCLRLRVISPLPCQYRPHRRGHQPGPRRGRRGPPPSRGRRQRCGERRRDPDRRHRTARATIRTST